MLERDMGFSIKKVTPGMRLAIFSGILVGTSYIPFPPWALLFCLVPLWISWLEDPAPKGVFIKGWVTQFLLTLIGFHWVAHTAVEYGHLPQFVGYLVLFGFCCIGHLHFPLAGWIWSLFNKRWTLQRGESLLLLVLLTALFERIYPMIFPWHLGYPWLGAKLPASQFADIFGFEGLSALTLAINGLLAWLWLKRQERDFLKRSLISLLLFLVLLNVAGHFWGQRRDWGSNEVRVLTIQANIGNFEKYVAERDYNFRPKIFNRYRRLTEEALAKDPSVDFVLWPETAFPDNLDQPFMFRPLQKQLLSFIRKMEVPFLVGAYSEDIRSKLYYNGVFQYNAEGRMLGYYRKSILLAFGEYFPGSNIFPFLKNIVPAISDFGRGLGPQLLSDGSLGVGAQICYEGLFPWFSRALVEKGVQLFVNVTNDSWFGTYFEPRQHMIMTLARGIEFRRPLVRATNTGFTTAIEASGERHSISQQNHESYSIYTVKVGDGKYKSTYYYLQPWLGYLYLLLMLPTLARGIRRQGNF
jgi:apolipoprotein N-acyltransferase